LSEIKVTARRPEAVMDFDLMVIGGGMAGIGAAKAAADLGARTALAEHEKLGGT
jgi:glutathione reductase (NADPH)